MADAEEIARAERLAAAKKRVEQMKKKKGISKKEENKTALPETANSQGNAAQEPKPVVTADENKTKEEEPQAKSTAGFESHERKLSVSHLSKLRSSTFRESSVLGTPYSQNYDFPSEGDTAIEIYRKQAAKIEELEKENKRLANEAKEVEKRRRKAEKELEDLREAEVPMDKESLSQSENSKDVEILVCGANFAGALADQFIQRAEILALQRQNAQLLARSPRHNSLSSVSPNISADYESVLETKSSTIETMEMEISSLKSVIQKSTLNDEQKQQVVALQEKLSRAEKALEISQRELGDLKKNLDRTTEKVVKEGSERVSAETKLRTLVRESEETKALNKELLQKVEMLEKKISTLATLHKEHDARFQAQKRACEKAEKESFDLQVRLTEAQNLVSGARENPKQTSKLDTLTADNEDLDDLENERCERLVKKVKDLEKENSGLRREILTYRSIEKGVRESFSVVSPGAKFTEVDLGGGFSPKRNLSKVWKEGYLDFTDDDELLDFDEEAYRVAQEVEAKKRIDRIKDIKRGLKNWEGWRLDLVESRFRDIDGHGRTFEV